MNDPTKGKSTLEQLREIRDAQLKIVEELSAKFEVAKEELKRINKALKQWEPKGVKL